MQLIFCCAILFMGQALGSPSANRFIESLLRDALQRFIKADSLDPTKLKDYSFEYKDKTLVGKVKGKAKYSEGQLTGLSSVLRHSECTGPKKASGTTTIHCTLSFSKLETSFKGKVKYGILPKVTIVAKGKIRDTLIDIGIIQATKDLHPKVSSFVLRDIGSIKTTFTGLGPLNKHMKILEDNYKEKVPIEVSDVINSKFRKALEKAVPNVPLPKL